MIAWGPRLKDPLQMWRWGKVLFSWRSSTGCEPSLSHRSSNEIQVYSDECVCVWNIWTDVKLLPDDVDFGSSFCFRFFLFVMLCQPQLLFSTSISILEQGAGASWKVSCQRRHLPPTVIPDLASLAYLHWCDHLLFRVCFHSIFIFWRWEESQPKNLHGGLCNFLHCCRNLSTYFI